MGFEVNTEAMRKEAKKWDEVQAVLTKVAARLDANTDASGAFSILGKPLGDEHDKVATKISTWASQGTRRFGEIGDTLVWIAKNYTGTDADQGKRYKG